MDLSLLLPVIALNLREGHSLLDICAEQTDGRLALLAHQTRLPGHIRANFSNQEALREAQKLFSRCDADPTRFKEAVTLSRWRALDLPGQFTDAFDRALCLVPSTNDRHVLHRDEDNIYNNAFKKQRLSLPETQINLLASAFKCIRPGGSVVYGTGALSPVQNDGVVAQALEMLWHQTKTEFQVE